MNPKTGLGQIQGYTQWRISSITRDTLLAYGVSEVDISLGCVAILALVSFVETVDASLRGRQWVGFQVSPSRRWPRFGDN